MASPPLEFGCHQGQRDGLRPAFGACNGSASILRGERPERILQQRRRLDPRPPPGTDGVCDVEPLRNPVDPGRLFVGESFWRARPPEALSEIRVAVENTARFGGARADRAPAGDQPFARTLQLEL